MECLGRWISKSKKQEGKDLDRFEWIYLRLFHNHYGSSSVEKALLVGMSCGSGGPIELQAEQKKEPWMTGPRVLVSTKNMQKSIQNLSRPCAYYGLRMKTGRCTCEWSIHCGTTRLLGRLKHTKPNRMHEWDGRHISFKSRSGSRLRVSSHVKQRSNSHLWGKWRMATTLTNVAATSLSGLLAQIPNGDLYIYIYIYWLAKHSRGNLSQKSKSSEEVIYTWMEVSIGFSFQRLSIVGQGSSLEALPPRL